MSEEPGRGRAFSNWKPHLTSQFETQPTDSGYLETCCCLQACGLLTRRLQITISAPECQRGARDREEAGERAPRNCSLLNICIMKPLLSSEAERQNWGCTVQRTLGHLRGSPGTRPPFGRKEASGQGGALASLPSISFRSWQLYPGERHPKPPPDWRWDSLVTKCGVLDSKDMGFSSCSVTHSLCVLVQVNLTSLSLSSLICKTEIIDIHQVSVVWGLKNGGELHSPALGPPYAELLLLPVSTAGRWIKS